MRLSEQVLKMMGLSSGLSGLFGETPKDKKPASAPLSYAQINKWSDYADANPGKDFNTLWAGFSKANPNSGIDPSVLQADLQKIRESAGRLAKKDGQMTGENTNTGLSFPRTIVDGKDYGRMNAMMQTQRQPVLPRTIPSSMIHKTLPSGVEDVWFDEKEQLVAFTNPSTGDIEYAERENLNHPMLKKKQPAMPMANPAELVVNR